MTTENSFSERLRELAFKKKIYQADLVSALNKDRGTISKWWNGEIVPGPKNIRLIAEFFECNIDWLATGEGDPYTGTSAAAIMSRNLSHSIGTGLANQVKPTPTPKETKPTKEEEFSISEMLLMTSAVLESKTVYRSALASNVRAFYQAVQQEIEMKQVREEIAAMRQENREVVERMARMEEMLASLGAKVPEQKREQENG